VSEGTALFSFLLLYRDGDSRGNLVTILLKLRKRRRKTKRRMVNLWKMQWIVTR